MTWKAWMLGALPQVEWYLPLNAREWPPIWHMSTEIVQEPGPSVLGQGQSLWMSELQGRTIGIAWDWAELRPGVPTLVDPNAVLTNLRFVAEDGTPAAPLVATVCMNRIVHELSWQGPVRMLLQDARGFAPAQAPARTAKAPRMTAPLAAAVA